jgi:5-methylcytosine-specific restriction endonuclease McrA
LTLLVISSTIESTLIHRATIGPMTERVMADRKGISASLRWKVFQNDDFRCRYCGRQAGEDGTVLHVDHVVSVVDGGTNAISNLVTACQRCNGGKGAISLDNVPGSLEAVEFAEKRVVTLRQQAEAIARNNAARAALRQEVINLICGAYRVKEIRMSNKDVDRFVYLSTVHGADTLADWISQAAARRVQSSQILRYVHGIIRKIREESGATQ